MNARPIVRIAFLLALISGTALAYDGSPPTSRTGAPAIGGKPAESTCLGCHNDFALNTGGTIELLNAPSYYQPGTTYTLTVRLTSGQTAANAGRVWGFQLTAINSNDGNGAGTFANVAGQGTKIAVGSGSFATRSYAEVDTGNKAGVASPVEWQVSWTAPNPGVGRIFFYMSGVAADGGTGNNGDWVYTGSFSTHDITPAVSTSWGQVKASYRH